MTPEIIFVAEKKLMGHCLTMSIANDKTGGLWCGFMPRRKEISNVCSSDLFSVRFYLSIPNFGNFNPADEFDMWAAVEVADFSIVPQGMNTTVLPAGYYAVFHYTGSNTDNNIFEFIYGTWLPSSGYNLDNRPHFEILGAKYKNGDADSEEDIFVPITW